MAMAAEKRRLLGLEVEEQDKASRAGDYGTFARRLAHGLRYPIDPHGA